MRRVLPTNKCPYTLLGVVVCADILILSDVAEFTLSIHALIGEVLSG